MHMWDNIDKMRKVQLSVGTLSHFLLLRTVELHSSLNALESSLCSTLPFLFLYSQGKGK